MKKLTKQDKKLKKLSSDYNKLQKAHEKLQRQSQLQERKEKDLIREVQNRGYFVVKRTTKQDLSYTFDEPSETFKIGIISDTHIGSLYQQLSHVRSFYQECHSMGITKIIHAGDLFDGNGKVYVGHIYEMFLHGIKNQLYYAKEHYPKIDGITTYLLAGNHDESFWKSDGYDICEELAKKRDDIEYLGMYGAFLNIGNIKIYVMHGAGGTAYARSYKMQKIIEQMAPENKPHILILGHYHCANYLPMYRNVEGFQVGCFQAQTPYAKRKGLYPTLGGLILTIHQNEKGLHAVETYWRYYYDVIKDDY